jgi:hypothetical protein
MADNKISDLPTVALTTADLIEVEAPAQAAGSRSRKATLAEVIALALDNDTALAADSATLAATQHAVKNFVTNAIAAALSVLAHAVNTPANSSGTVTLNFASASKYIGAITLAANVTTLAFSNLPGAGKYAEYELHIKQDATGGRTFAIPASHKALGGSDLAIASAANAVTIITASTTDNGTTWRYAMQESA